MPVRERSPDNFWGALLRAGSDPGPSSSGFCRTGHLPRPAGSCRWGLHGTDTAKHLSLPSACSPRARAAPGFPGQVREGCPPTIYAEGSSGWVAAPAGAGIIPSVATPAGGHDSSTFSPGPSPLVRNLFPRDRKSVV